MIEQMEGKEGSTKETRTSRNMKELKKDGRAGRKPANKKGAVAGNPGRNMPSLGLAGCGALDERASRHNLQNGIL